MILAAKTLRFSVDVSDTGLFVVIGRIWSSVLPFSRAPVVALLVCASGVGVADLLAVGFGTGGCSIITCTIII